MPRCISIILFDGFELLDVFGPAELLNLVDDYTLEFVSPTGEAVASSQGVQVLATASYNQLAAAPDIILLPGGVGTRPLVQNTEFLSWLREVGQNASLVLSVCTGAAVLAAAGLLEGRAATTNKRAYAWATSYGKKVNWQPKARWVHEGKFWTSSGVAAGMDMSAAFIAHEQGTEVADAITRRIELTVSKDPHKDPFAL